jgi:magnesium chelatase subunit I
MEQEARAPSTEADAVPVHVPGFMKEIVAELSQLARRSSEVSQRSGVSVRVSIANAETLAAAALKRAVRLDEPTASPRISDLPAVVASTAGKIELETLGDEEREDRVVEKLLARATVNVFNRHFALSELGPLIERFENGAAAEVGEYVPSSAHEAMVGEIPELRRAIGRLEVGEAPASVASGVEFMLEGLHLNRRLNKERHAGGVRYAR